MTAQEKAALPEELAAEPLSPEDVEAINEGIRQARAGQLLSLEEVNNHLKDLIQRGQSKKC